MRKTSVREEGISIISFIKREKRETKFLIRMGRKGEIQPQKRNTDLIYTVSVSKDINSRGMYKKGIICIRMWIDSIEERKESFVL